MAGLAFGQCCFSAFEDFFLFKERLTIAIVTKKEIFFFFCKSNKNKYSIFIELFNFGNKIVTWIPIIQTSLIFLKTEKYVICRTSMVFRFKEPLSTMLVRFQKGFIDFNLLIHIYYSMFDCSV